jgi:hypothetical protein
MTNLVILKQAGLKYGIPLGNNVSGGEEIPEQPENPEQPTISSVPITIQVTAISNTHWMNGNISSVSETSVSIFISSFLTFPVGTTISGNVAQISFFLFTQDQSTIQINQTGDGVISLTNINAMIQINNYQIPFNIPIQSLNEGAYRSGSINFTTYVPITIFQNTQTGGGVVNLGKIGYSLLLIVTLTTGGQLYVAKIMTTPLIAIVKQSGKKYGIKLGNSQSNGTNPDPELPTTIIPLTAVEILGSKITSYKDGNNNEYRQIWRNWYTFGGTNGYRYALGYYVQKNGSSNLIPIQDSLGNFIGEVSMYLDSFTGSVTENKGSVLIHPTQIQIGDKFIVRVYTTPSLEQPPPYTGDFVQSIFPITFDSSSQGTGQGYPGLSTFNATAQVISSTNNQMTIATSWTAYRCSFNVRLRITSNNGSPIGQDNYLFHHNYHNITSTVTDSYNISVPNILSGQKALVEFFAIMDNDFFMMDEKLFTFTK